MQTTTRQYSFPLLLILCALLHTGITYAYAITRMYTFKSSLLDDGTFDQVLWNFLHHGMLLSTTNYPFTPQNWLGFHFSPVLLLLVPFYGFWPHPELLQIVQSLCFGFSGVVLFYALLAAGAKEWEAFAGSLFYWCNPFIISAAIWDFHEIAFATLFIAIALWALCAHRFLTMMLALILLLLTKEHYGLSVIGFGLLWQLRYHERFRGSVIILFGVFTFATLFMFVMPALHSGHHQMFENNADTASRYSWLKGSLDAKIVGFFSLLSYEDAGSISGMHYLFLLFISGLMLPLAAPLYLLPTLGDVAANLLSANSMQRSVATYHTAAVIPIVILAAFKGYERVRKYCLAPRLLKNSMLILAIFPLCLTIYPFRIWEVRYLQLSMNAEDNASIQLIRTLIDEETISVQCNIGIFFSQRPALYPFQSNVESSLYSSVVLRLQAPFSATTQNHLNVDFCTHLPDYIMHLRELMGQPNWHVAYWHAPWLVMMRSPTNNDEKKWRADIAKRIDQIETKTP